MKSQKSYRFILLIGTLCLSLFLAYSPCLAADTYKMKMVAFLPKGHPRNEVLRQFITMVDEKTNGAVKITLFEGNLGHPRDHWDMLEQGAVDMAFLGEGYNASRMPVGCLFNLPFELTDLGLLYDVYGEWLDKGYLKEITDHFKLLLYRPTDKQTLFTKGKKIENINDFKGLKIRALQGMMGETLTALGATPVSMRGGEVYMAMSTGIVDGYITGADNVLSRKLYEVSDYSLDVPIYYGIWVMCMNQKSWNKLPKNLQDIIEEAAQIAHKAERDQAESDMKAAWQGLKDKTKLEIHTIGPDEWKVWKKAVSKVADDYLKEFSAKGYPVKEAYQLILEKEK